MNKSTYHHWRSRLIECGVLPDKMDRMLSVVQAVLMQGGDPEETAKWYFRNQRDWFTATADLPAPDPLPEVRYESYADVAARFVAACHSFDGHVGHTFSNLEEENG